MIKIKNYLNDFEMNRLYLSSEKWPYLATRISYKLELIF